MTRTADIAAGERVRIRWTVRDGLHLDSGRWHSAYAGRYGIVTDTYPHGLMVLLAGRGRPLPFGRCEVARLGD